MTEPEVPLLRESAPFVRRLMDAVRLQSASRYHFHRRVNWSYRYGAGFYRTESRIFRESPDAYLSGEPGARPEVEDVYALRLSLQQIVTVVLKVVAHRLFRVLGVVFQSMPAGAGTTTYRKAYVDDIELVFDPDEQGVLRAIYPFPINVRRQLRYIAFVWARRFPHRLTGVPYGLGDLLRLLRMRDVRSLQRMESRGQLRHALEVAASGIRTVQLSDEFEIGSLDFVRLLGRKSLAVRNSAHGVGKYFPVHAYPVFQVVTGRQAEYYHAVRGCRYERRLLNDRSGASAGPTAASGWHPGRVSCVVFLSQSFVGVSEIVSQSEADVLAELARELAGMGGVELYYRPHPNCHQPVVPAGFRILADLALVNDKPGTLFASFFSTCQIDPAFKGRKILLRTGLIHPEIAFDSDQPILDVEELVNFIRPLSDQDVRATRASKAASQ